jgi:antitoxin component of MazEF toxin-antitoxin module
MRIFIVQKMGEYSIMKVPDRLLDEFKSKMGEQVVVEGKDIQEAIVKFSDLERPAECEFNPELKKYKPQHQQKVH